MSARADLTKLDRKLDGLERDMVFATQANGVPGDQQLMFDASNDHVLMMDEKLICRAVNKTFLVANGLKRDQVVGRSIVEIKEYLFFEEKAEPIMEQCMEGAIAHCQGWFYYPVLGKRCMDATCYPYYTSNRRVAGIIISARDITEAENACAALETSLDEIDKRTVELQDEIERRKETETALYRYQDLLLKIIENIPIGIWVGDSSFRVTMWNATMEEITGVPRAEVLGLNLFERFPNLVAAGLQTHCEHVVSTGTPCALTHLPVYGKDLNEVRVYANVRASAIKDAKGNVVGIVAAVADTTENFRALEALKESQRRLATLMDNLPGMAYRCLNDENWTLEFVSKGSLDLVDYDRDYLVGNPANTYKNRVHPDDQSKIREDIDRAVAERRPFELIYRLKTASEEYKWVWEQGMGVFSEEGEMVALEGFVTDFTNQKRAELELRKENMRLRSSVKERYRFRDIVGKSQAMQEVYELILRAAATEANVIIYGESGTGKELVARAIHDMSDRKEKEFVPVNCGAIPENLLESEFFGYKKGAFTGATMDKRGYLELADGGTLFLDELGEIALKIQAKLLRAIEGGGYMRVGGVEVRKPSIRIIAATNRNLTDAIRKGLMREDFFYRIHIIPIVLPPLRKRKDDIPLLADHFLSMDGGGQTPQVLPARVREAIQSYDWPGNVRELRNAMRRYITLGKLDFLGVSQVESEGLTEMAFDCNDLGNQDLNTVMARYEKQVILKTLVENQWHRSKVASFLGIDRKTLFNKMKEHQLIKSS